MAVEVPGVRINTGVTRWFERLEHAVFDGETVTAPFLAKGGVVADEESLALVRAVSILGGQTPRGLAQLADQARWIASSEREGILIEHPRSASAVTIQSERTRVGNHHPGHCS